MTTQVERYETFFTWLIVDTADKEKCWFTMEHDGESGQLICPLPLSRKDVKRHDNSPMSLKPIEMKWECQFASPGEFAVIDPDLAITIILAFLKYKIICVD